MASIATRAGSGIAPGSDLRARRHAEPTARETCHALLAAVRGHDLATARHSASVVGLSVMVARRLELSPGTLADVECVALLHDVGKLTVPGRLLRKEAPLTDEEWLIMRGHADAGARLIEQLPEVAALVPAVRAHHERWDGRGYPDGLAGEDIPLPSRITFVCDAYDAMTSGRPYGAARSEVDAGAEIRREAGRQFCPSAAEALLAVLEACGRVPAVAA
jgi:HD-GYP domain-containing protein (c-di-GMP phosphodiesterase class II)